MDLHCLFQRNQLSLLMVEGGSCAEVCQIDGELAGPHAHRRAVGIPNAHASDVLQQLTRLNEPDELRDETASYRKLARKARITSNSSALKTAVEQFDDDARRIDRLGERR